MSTSTPSIYERFTRVAADRKNEIAVVGRDRSLTYGELAVCSNNLAARLVSAGHQPGKAVIVHANRSLEAIAAILAILQVGGAYVPLDPSYPAAIKQQYIDDLNAEFMFTTSRSDPTPISSGMTCLEVSLAEPEGADVAPVERWRDTDENTPAYIMFTSGSTGRPKGVVVPHRGVTRLVIEQNYIDIAPDDRLIQLSPLTFDASTFEIWGALLNGGRLVLYEETVFDAFELNRLVVQENVTIMWLTAALFHLIVRRSIGILKTLRVLLAGGDVLHAAAVKTVFAHYPALTVINGYGPTENTTFTCCHRMTAGTFVGESVPIGRPIAGTTVHVLDQMMRSVTVGAVGELYAAGKGVALGYLGSAERSKGSFIPDPFDPGKLLYKTGDLVRQIGEIYEFVGRMDNQAKIRGHRVAVEEVERVLNDVDGVEDGVVCVQLDANGDKRLAAFIRSQEEPKRHASFVRKTLMQTLPTYMIPDAIIVRNDLPINENGKINKRLLARTVNPEGGRSEH